ncbi:MAG: PH domain-containing protein [Ilumatobacteraceae bacterium]
MTSEDLRPDIAQAVARMRSKVGARRELNKLPELLLEGETCDRILSGTYGGGNGILALTNQRILFLKEGVVTSKSEDFPLKNISSIQFKKGLVLGSITIFASGNKAEISNVEKVGGQDFVDLVRQRISSVASSPPGAPLASTAPDP